MFLSYSIHGLERGIKSVETKNDVWNKVPNCLAAQEYMYQNNTRIRAYAMRPVSKCHISFLVRHNWYLLNDNLCHIVSLLLCLRFVPTNYIAKCIRGLGIWYASTRNSWHTWLNAPSWMWRWSLLPELPSKCFRSEYSICYDFELLVSVLLNQSLWCYPTCVYLSQILIHIEVWRFQNK